MTSSRKPAEPTKYALGLVVRAGQHHPATVHQGALGAPRERRVESDTFPGMPNVYEIKLRTIGYRLVYEAIESRLVVTVITVGKREQSKVYDAATNRRRWIVEPIVCSGIGGNESCNSLFTVELRLTLLLVTVPVSPDPWRTNSSNSVVTMIMLTLRVISDIRYRDIHRPHRHPSPPLGTKP